MTALARLARQRWVPKRPHAPSSQRLGARMLARQHWLQAGRLERHRQYHDPEPS